MEGSDELSWDDVLKYNDLANDTINAVGKNNVKNITSQNTLDNTYSKQEDMSEDLSVTIDQDFIPPSTINCQISIPSTSSRSNVTVTQMTNIISYPSSKMSTEQTSRYTCNTTEHVLTDPHTKCDSTSSLLHKNVTPKILERALTLPVVSDVCTKIASVTSPLQPCVKMTINTGSYLAGGVKTIIHYSAPSIP